MMDWLYCIALLKRMAVVVFETEATISKNWASSAHRRLFLAQWGLRPTPEWFDHSIDLYYQWSRTNNPLWVERGVFGSLALKGGAVLELCCGDGFNAKHFYSLRSSHVLACDFEPSAIRTAKRKNSANNIDYVLADIRVDMPTGKFANIAWDAAIEHFTPDEIQSILSGITGRLTSDGILSGYTIVERETGRKHIPQHENEFKSKEDLKSFLTPYLRNVKVFETIYPTRHNLYFWASNGTIPFAVEWPHSI
jgi:SAM-dependent methyltransferase